MGDVRVAHARRRLRHRLRRERRRAVRCSHGDAHRCRRRLEDAVGRAVREAVGAVVTCAGEEGVQPEAVEPRRQPVRLFDQRNRTVFVDVGDVVTVLVPNRTRARPFVREILDDVNARAPLGVVNPLVRGDHDVGVAVVIDVRNHRLFGPRARSDRNPRQQYAIAAAVNAQELFVAINHFHAAIEIEHGRSRRARAAIARRGLPPDRTVSIEDEVVDRGRHADLGNPVAVEIRNRRSAPTLREPSSGNRNRRVRRRVPDLRVRPVMVQHVDLPVAGDDDLGERIAVEVADGHVAIRPIAPLPHDCQLAVDQAIRRRARHDLERAVEVQVGHGGNRRAQ